MYAPRVHAQYPCRFQRQGVNGLSSKMKIKISNCLFIIYYIIPMHNLGVLKKSAIVAMHLSTKFIFVWYDTTEVYKLQTAKRLHFLIYLTIY